MGWTLIASSFPPGPVATWNCTGSFGPSSWTRCLLVFSPMNTSPSKTSETTKPQPPLKLLIQPSRVWPTMRAGSRPGAGVGRLLVRGPASDARMGGGDRDRSRWRPASRPCTALGSARTPARPAAALSAVMTCTASKPICVLPVLRCITNSICSPCRRGRSRWELLRMPTKRSPRYLVDVTKPQVSRKLLTWPVHFWPTRSWSSWGMPCTFVAWHFPLPPAAISKTTLSPACRLLEGLEPWCKKRSPSKCSDTMKPHSPRKLRMTPLARWPMRASGLGRPAMFCGNAGTMGCERRAGMLAICRPPARIGGPVRPPSAGRPASAFRPPGAASLIRRTLVAWTPFVALSSFAIWNSTSSPCCRPLGSSCEFALRPTKMSPSKRFELRNPQLLLKLFTQPRRRSPRRLLTSSLRQVAFTAC
mmetsp:Transcript_7290/g.20443  ORF Transcript_7290/g.20443 Transcript_7290/m.20443 type:complete len:418 (-) Transcript_7290:854-2107(-)